MTSTGLRSRGAGLAVLHSGRQDGVEVSEDAHGAELPETDGAS